MISDSSPSSSMVSDSSPSSSMVSDSAPSASMVSDMPDRHSANDHGGENYNSSRGANRPTTQQTSVREYHGPKGGDFIPTPNDYGGKQTTIEISSGSCKRNAPAGAPLGPQLPNDGPVANMSNTTPLFTTKGHAPPPGLPLGPQVP